MKAGYCCRALGPPSVYVDTSVSGHGTGLSQVGRLPNVRVLSSSQYSNPVFLMPKPLLRNGSPGGLRFVWDGRSVNRAIKTDSFLIPRVEDLIEGIARLKHGANSNGCLEMWIPTLDLRTSFWQLTLNEDCRPLISFNTPAGTYMGTCVLLGLLTTSQEMQRFAERTLKAYSKGHLGRLRLTLMTLVR
jgi:hypothetical protein